MNALSELLREQSAAHRAAAAERPDDPRPARSAAALEALADHADAQDDAGAFQLRYLLGHHIVDGRFAWADEQCGRAIERFGYDRPVRDEMDLDQFLMDLCDIAKSDAARHIGEHEEQFDRADAAAIAERFGLAVERVHGALDTGRGYRLLCIVGIPAAHALDDSARAALEAIDGVVVAPGSRQQYGDDPPLLIKNVPAASEPQARERVAGIVGIDPAALGVTTSPRALS